METVLLAMQDTQLSVEPVNLHPLLDLLTSAVKLGIGKTNSVLLVPMDTLLMVAKYVLKSVINAKLTITLENVPLASRDTILSMVPVHSHHQTTPTLLTSDVEVGIGTTKFAFLAQTTGFSTQTEFVFQ